MDRSDHLLPEQQSANRHDDASSTQPYLGTQPAYTRTTTTRLEVIQSNLCDAYKKDQSIQFANYAKPSAPKKPRRNDQRQAPVASPQVSDTYGSQRGFLNDQGMPGAAANFPQQSPPSNVGSLGPISGLSFTGPPGYPQHTPSADWIRRHRHQPD